MPDIEEVERDYENSRPLDVHKWSDYDEVNEFIDSIYIRLFREGERKSNIKRAHVKVVLLDLYVLWSVDPTACLSVSRNRTDYRARSRYNELHISHLTIATVDILIQAGLVEQKIGYLDRERNIGRLSRIWPTAELFSLFEKARFLPLDIESSPNRETIILRDDHGQNVEYRDRTKITDPMRKLVQRYNAMLAHTFIDIPELDRPVIELSASDGRPKTIIQISQSEKFVRRVFNRGDETFSKGGRFYGGFWQRIPKKWRAKIFINDAPTNEVDYSGLHIVLLYALKTGTDYWATVGSDPYEISKPPFIEDAVQSRAIVKRLLLITLNAQNEDKAFNAFKKEAAPESPERHFTHEQCRVIMTAIREKHSPIAKYLSSDAGIDLMNADSNITAMIIERFLAKDIPILPIHDSYIVPAGQEEELESAMIDAFYSFTGVKNVKTKDSQMRFSKRTKWQELGMWAQRIMSKNLLIFQKASVTSEAVILDWLYPTKRSSGYKFRLNQFVI